MAESDDQTRIHLTEKTPNDLLVNGSAIYSPDENENIKVKENNDTNQTIKEDNLNSVVEINVLKNTSNSTITSNATNFLSVTPSKSNAKDDKLSNESSFQIIINPSDMIEGENRGENKLIISDMISETRNKTLDYQSESKENADDQNVHLNKSVCKTSENKEHFEKCDNLQSNLTSVDSKESCDKDIFPLKEHINGTVSVDDVLDKDKACHNVPSTVLQSSEDSKEISDKILQFNVTNKNLQTGGQYAVVNCDEQKNMPLLLTRQTPIIEEESEKLEEKHLLLSKLNIMPKSELLRNNELKIKQLEDAKKINLEHFKEDNIELTCHIDSSINNCNIESGSSKSTKIKILSKCTNSGPLKKRRRLSPNVSPRCNDPFKKGWKRELVYRATCDESKSRIADVYYYSPGKEKLRSYREIEEYLKRTKEKDLGIDCFTFSKVTIHEAPQEIVRYAKPRHENMKDLYKKKHIANNFGNKRTKSLKTTDSKNDNISSETSRNDSSKTIDTPIQESLTARHQPKRPKLNLVKNITNKRRGKILFGRPKKTHSRLKFLEKEEKPCSLSCPGHIGILPSLHCGICLCLFHPSCVGLTDSSKPFICSSPDGDYYHLILKRLSLTRLKCITDRKQITKRYAENGKKVQTDVLNISTSPVSIEVNPELLTDEDYESSVPSNKILPSLLSAPPNPIRNSSCEKNRPPPPLKKAPFKSNSSVPVKALATWTPPSGLTPRQPPPLRLASSLQTIRFPNNGPVQNRPPPPLTARPCISFRMQLNRPVFNHMNSVVSQSQNIITAVTLPKTVLSQPSQTSYNGQVTSLSSNVKLTNLNFTSPKSTPLVSHLKTYSNTSSNKTEQPRQIFLKPRVMAQHSSSGIITPIPGTMKFVLKTNSGTTTEVLVPQFKQDPSLGPPQPKYIVVNKQGQPTGLVIGIGREVIQLPILNPSSSNSERLLKDAVASSNTKKIHETIVLDDDTGKNEPNPESRISTNFESKSLNSSTLLPKKVSIGPVSMNDSGTTGDNSKNASKLTKRQQVDTNPLKCNIQWLHGGINSLMKIFEYLHQDDLSRVSSVCQTWHWLASQPNLWKTITLDGILVYDWENLVAIMKKYKSVRLDMRKMPTFEDRNRTWHGFAAVLQDLKMLRFIHFGCIPVSILHTVVNTLSQLEELTADFITDICRESEISTSNCRMDLRKFGQLRCLQKLRLRGICGIQLQGSAVGYSLNNLESLTNLTYLSLTTLKDFPVMEFQFLKSLKNLETLELGECSSWSNQTFENLHFLENLKHLRLEYGGMETSDGLTTALSHLVNLVHLELFHFKLDEHLMNHVEQMQNLRALSLWPLETEKGEVINTLILKTVRKLLNLKIFVWGVIMDHFNQDPVQPVGNQFSDDDVIDIVSDDEDENKSSAAECIPFSLIELTAEDGVENPKEYLSLVQLHSRLSKILPKPTRIIYPVLSEKGIELSQIKKL